MADDNGTTNPVADLLLELLTHFAKKNWVNENEDPIKLILTLENGLTFRGHVVPRERWIEANLLPPNTGTNANADNHAEEPRSVEAKADGSAEESKSANDSQQGDTGGTVTTTPAPGSWPRDTIDNVTATDDRHDMVYLTHVEFLSGDTWVPGCNMACDRQKVHGKGDQYLSEHSA